jgi:hypothetical protein
MLLTNLIGTIFIGTTSLFIIVFFGGGGGGGGVSQSYVADMRTAQSNVGFVFMFMLAAFFCSV